MEVCLHLGDWSSVRWARLGLAQMLIQMKAKWQKHLAQDSSDLNVFINVTSCAWSWGMTEKSHFPGSSSQGAHFVRGKTKQALENSQHPSVTLCVTDPKCSKRPGGWISGARWRKISFLSPLCVLIAGPYRLHPSSLFITTTQWGTSGDLTQRAWIWAQ